MELKELEAARGSRFRDGNQILITQRLEENSDDLGIARMMLNHGVAALNAGLNRTLIVNPRQILRELLLDIKELCLELLDLRRFHLLFQVGNKEK